MQIKKHLRNYEAINNVINMFIGQKLENYRKSFMDF